MLTQAVVQGILLAIGYFSAYRKIQKHMDTVVAFTKGILQGIVSIVNVCVLVKNQDRPRKRKGIQA